jgi:hypothetical protein
MVACGRAMTYLPPRYGVLDMTAGCGSRLAGIMGHRRDAQRRGDHMTSKLVLLTYESWSNLDSALEGLTDEEATTRHEGGSSIAWSVAHVTTMVDSWLNVKFQQLPPNPVISNPDFRFGGSGGATDWRAVGSAVDEVRAKVRPFLDGKEDADLDLVIPYDGSIPLLRQTGLPLRYALMRIAAHHWIHMGEIVTVRSRLGWQEPTSPGWGRSLI